MCIRDRLIALASEWHDADGTDPDDLARMFVEFVKKIKATYGRVTHVYCDSAEQVLKQGLRSALIKNQMGDIKVDNSRKEQITNRIFTLTTLTAQDRFYYTEDCESLQEALSMACLLYTSICGFWLIMAFRKASQRRLRSRWQKACYGPQRSQIWTTWLRLSLTV